MEESKRLALEVRAELGVGPFGPLDPTLLAKEYGIPVLQISDISGCPAETVARLAEPGNAWFSAALVPCGTGMFIVENDAHAPARRTASLAHEMAHVLWEHKFTAVLVNGDGCRAADPAIEDEADRLGGELLIPFKAALTAARRGWSDEDVAAHYEVSVPYAKMRMNRSGARTIIARERARRGP
ncbi:MAG: ImmA/IrrE family metallo-endopeptidase [Motilibacteraceae bacterium]